MHYLLSPEQPLARAGSASSVQFKYSLLQAPDLFESICSHSVDISWNVWGRRSCPAHSGLNLMSIITWIVLGVVFHPVVRTRQRRGSSEVAAEVDVE